MNGTLAQRAGAAATAGWWTLLIAALWLTASWLIWLWIFAAQPDWIFTLWGGHMNWDEVRSLMITFFALFKLILFIAMMAVIWLTIWTRKLKRLSA